MFATKYYHSALRNITGMLFVAERPPHRTITTSFQRLASYYDTLGIPASSTQSDIKAAYYKLSMIYHPDKNKDSDVASEKFRQITEAYEVLGNFKLRRLYDKGIIRTAGPQYSNVQSRYPDDPVDDEEPEDAQTKFYKAHMKKSQVPHSSGRTPIYDFDEWSRAHYGASFERRQTAKMRFEERAQNRANESRMAEKEYLLFGLVFVLTSLALVFSNERMLDFVVDKTERPETGTQGKATTKSTSSEDVGNTKN